MATAQLAVATLHALMQFSPRSYCAHLKDFFLLLTALISREYAPPIVQCMLSELFSTCILQILDLLLFFSVSWGRAVSKLWTSWKGPDAVLQTLRWGCHEGLVCTAGAMKA